MYKVSVIIATYKRPAETLKCLGLINQSHGLKESFDLEVIVVDSSPNLDTRLAIIAKNFNFNLNYIKLKKQTLPGKARNIGINKAKNEL